MFVKFCMAVAHKPYIPARMTDGRKCIPTRDAGKASSLPVLTFPVCMFQQIRRCPYSMLAKDPFNSLQLVLGVHHVHLGLVSLLN